MKSKEDIDLSKLSTEELQRLADEKVKRESRTNSVGRAVEDARMRRYLKNAGSGDIEGLPEDTGGVGKRHLRKVVADEVRKQTEPQKAPPKRQSGILGFLFNEPDPNRKKTKLDKFLGM